MKEALARTFIALLMLGAVWLLIFVVAIVGAAQVQGWPTRIAIVLAAVVSVPLYVLVQLTREHIAQKKRAKARHSIAVRESQAWADICAQPQELKILATVPPGEPVDLRVRQPPGPHQRLDPHIPHGAKVVCWMEPPATRCAHPNIANVQTELISMASWLRPAAPDRQGEAAHLMWNYSITQEMRTEIEAMTARYALEVGQAERVSQLIERFRVTVLDDQTCTLLAETFIHRKSWIGAPGRSPAGEVEARHYPDRDLTIGKMLELVFPQSPVPPQE